MVPDFKEIHIESTNSCGYKCIMCPREKLTRSIGFMSLEDFNCVVNRVGKFEGIFHLHGFGETLLDRKFIEKLKLLKEKSPKSQSLVFSTLGVKVKDDYFLQLIESGLGSLAISLYGFTEESYKQVHGYAGFSLVKRNLELLSKAMKASSSSFKSYIKIPGPQIFSSLPISDPPEKKDFCRWAEDLGFEIRQWSYAHNYSDGRSYNKPQERTCPVINGKRKELLNISWNLDVIPCAYDFNGTIRFGNLREQSLEEIFSGEAYFNFLIAHQSNHLCNYKACQSCEKQDYE